MCVFQQSFWLFLFNSNSWMISNAPQNLFVNILKAGEEFFYFKSILTYNFTDFKIKNT